MLIGHNSSAQQLYNGLKEKKAIILYGSEGSGKTTLINMIAKKLNLSIVYEPCEGMDRNHLLHLFSYPTKTKHRPLVIELSEQPKFRSGNFMMIDFDNDRPINNNIDVLQSIVYKKCKEAIDIKNETHIDMFNRYIKKIREIREWPLNIGHFLISSVEEMFQIKKSEIRRSDEIDEATLSYKLYREDDIEMISRFDVLSVKNECFYYNEEIWNTCLHLIHKNTKKMENYYIPKKCKYDYIHGFLNGTRFFSGDSLKILVQMIMIKNNMNHENAIKRLKLCMREIKIHE